MSPKADWSLGNPAIPAPLTKCGKRCLLANIENRLHEKAERGRAMDRRLTGPGAGVMKYDFLTAIGLIGLRGAPGLRTSMQRLATLITARYNWRLDEVAIGQRDLARIWAVDERTVKREVKRLDACRLLVCIRPGVRGRVAAYRLNMRELAAQSQPHWLDVGPDFAERMAALAPEPTKVVRLHVEPRDDQEGQGGTWRAVRQRLREQDPALFANWFDQLHFVGREEGAVVLRAASPFIGRYVETHLSRMLAAAIEAELGPGCRLQIRCSA